MNSVHLHLREFSFFSALSEREDPCPLRGGPPGGRPRGREGSAAEEGAKEEPQSQDADETHPGSQGSRRRKVITRFPASGFERLRAS